MRTRDNENTIRMEKQRYDILQISYLKSNDKYNKNFMHFFYELIDNFSWYLVNVWFFCNNSYCINYFYEYIFIFLELNPIVYFWETKKSFISLWCTYLIIDIYFRLRFSLVNSINTYFRLRNRVLWREC